MIDIEMIRKHTEEVRVALLKRMDNVDLQSILDLDSRRRREVQSLEEKRSKRNSESKKIHQLKMKGSETADLEALASEMRDEISGLERELEIIEKELQSLLAQLPNLPDDRVPAGGKEANQVIRVHGTPPVAARKPLDHVELCTRHKLVDYERGTKLGGNGSWIYTGMGAALEWALVDFFCREHFADGYEFILPPHLLLEECGYTAGQFPKFRDGVYHLQTEGDERPRFLLPTSETAILNVYRDEILPFEDLPLKAFAYTPCYRREAGSYRTEERGTIRGHQFNKVELFQFVAPEQAEQSLAELLTKAEKLVQELGLHFRTSLLAAKDASASMAMTYDVEVWLPSIGGYKEVSSVSWARDFQARRANIRFKRDKTKRAEYVHTLNGSGLATSRVLPAIVEQCQQDDGSIRVPEPLRAWLRTDVLR